MKCDHLLFTFAESMPGVTYPLLKSVGEQDRERKNVRMGGADVTVSVALIMQCG